MGKIPEYPKTFVDDILLDEYCLEHLRKIYDEKD
jgi:hypothetical protein